MINRRNFLASIAAVPIAVAVPAFATTMATVPMATETITPIERKHYPFVILSRDKDGALIQNFIDPWTCLGLMYGRDVAQKIFDFTMDEAVRIKERHEGDLFRLVRITAYPRGCPTATSNPLLAPYPPGQAEFNKDYSRPYCQIMVSMCSPDELRFSSVTYFTRFIFEDHCPGWRKSDYKPSKLL